MNGGYVYLPDNFANAVGELAVQAAQAGATVTGDFPNAWAVIREIADTRKPVASITHAQAAVVTAHGIITDIDVQVSMLQFIDFGTSSAVVKLNVLKEAPDLLAVQIIPL